MEDLTGNRAYQAAGFVDIVGYTVVGRILNANLSSNSVEIAFQLLHHNPSKAMARAWALLLGMIAAEWVLQPQRYLPCERNLWANY